MIEFQQPLRDYLKLLSLNSDHFKLFPFLYYYFRETKSSNSTNQNHFETSHNFDTISIADKLLTSN